MTAVPPREGEQQYGEVIAAIRARGGERLGLMTSWAWLDDPRRLTFTLARYKFVAKMLAGAETALEIGCGDGFGARVVRQSVGSLVAVDFDPEFIESAKATASDKHPIEFRRHDMLAGPVQPAVNACYSMDVLEHIDPSNEGRFLENVAKSLLPRGVCIIGTPSLESQPYASKYSKMGHVNCKTQTDLRKKMKEFFENVFMFSMNDEVVHTGYEKMSHYNLALCCGPLYHL
jgi:cyclopropane fatty-acyl-phospholipid synthase-like methyltransferase